ncbi:hypothetical protein [Emcibacter sp.]|uniref:hypothetical protein n=1 Tax=Emcibacter sp. TaxID=1979954 RepID=UPI002AA61151|nr:hypothetical protein [Emcibacter sp.]
MKLYSLIIAGVFWFFATVSVQAQSETAYLENIQAADQQLLLENFSSAQKLYNQAKSYAHNANEKSYVHYKLGTVYLRLNEKLKARQEWKNALDILDREGDNSGIRFHLKQALANSGM